MRLIKTVTAMKLNYTIPLYILRRCGYVFTRIDNKPNTVIIVGSLPVEFHDSRTIVCFPSVVSPDHI